MSFMRVSKLSNLHLYHISKFSHFKTKSSSNPFRQKLHDGATPIFVPVEPEQIVHWDNEKKKKLDFKVHETK
jgi:hypothetical protein